MWVASECGVYQHTNASLTITSAPRMQPATDTWLATDYEGLPLCVSHYRFKGCMNSARMKTETPKHNTQYFFVHKRHRTDGVWFIAHESHS